MLQLNAPVIKCIIVEDDELAAKSLIKILSEIDKIELQGHYLNPMEAQNEADLDDTDLIFLDLELPNPDLETPKMTGLDFIKSLSNPPRVIVTTSCRDFAIRAFEIHAVDFILKPITAANVLSALTSVAL